MSDLTVRQPWAWAIIHGGKDVENRSRSIAGSYRGPVAIHAGLMPDLGAFVFPEMVGSIAMTKLFEPSSQWFSNSRTGHIIGVVDLVDVHVSDTHAERWNVELERNEQCSPWAMRDHHHLVLANPRAIEPIPAKGKLGLWKPDAELLAQVEATQ